MSQIGGPIPSALAGVVPSHETVGKAAAKREREKSDATRRTEDAVELTVGGVDESETVEETEEHDPKRYKEKQQPRRGKGGAHGRHDLDGGDDEDDTPNQSGRNANHHIDITG